MKSESGFLGWSDGSGLPELINALVSLCWYTTPTAKFDHFFTI